MKDGRYIDVFAVEARKGAVTSAKILIFSHLLVHDDADCIVENALTKDDRVEFRVNLVGVKDGENSDRVGGREGGTEDEAFKESKLEPLEAQE